MSRGKIDISVNEPFDDRVVSESEIGRTSQELAADSSAANEEVQSKWKRLIKDFSLYDAMLLVSLIFVTAATIKLFFAFAQYGSYVWGKPWQIQY